MYSPPAKNYPTLFTFNGNVSTVWGAANKALTGMGFEVASSEKGSGKIETQWAATGHAPARKCQYGVNTYWENPTRRQQLSVVIKKVPGAAPAAAAPAFGAPAAAPGFPAAAPGGFAAPSQAPAAAPAAAARTMVIVVSKGESVLPEDCGDAPGTIEISNTDTVTEYRFLHAVGQALGQQMEAPPAP